jgi:hypothetical protein
VAQLGPHGSQPGDLGIGQAPFACTVAESPLLPAQAEGERPAGAHLRLLIDVDDLVQLSTSSFGDVIVSVSVRPAAAGSERRPQAAATENISECPLTSTFVRRQYPRRL